ncbi:MAG: LysR family transcriptional regulator [Hyphomicrobiaceae bacterium]|nr:LysR family transcriptional regulator [Hyphomicrobiaceae bacterium]
MDRLEAMSTFVAVVDAGGFSAAARQLGTPLATVSRRVADLEKELGVQLLVRTTRNISLTDVGQDYVMSCRRLLDDLAEAERSVLGEYRAPKGTLAINAPVVLGRAYLAPIVVDFLQAYPEVDVDLRLGPSGGNLVEQHIDLAVRIGALPDSSMIALRAGEIRHVVCASPGYLARRGVPTHPDDLSAHECVTLTPHESAAEWVFTQNKRTSKYPVRSRLTVTTAETAVDAAIAGVGITHLFCYQVSKSIADGTLKLLMRDFEPPPLPVHFVYASGRHMPQKLRAFIDFVLPRLKAKLVFNA